MKNVRGPLGIIIMIKSEFIYPIVSVWYIHVCVFQPFNFGTKSLSVVFFFFDE